MGAVDLGHLKALYKMGDDPWNFRTSAYEHEKFEATSAALQRDRYSSALELGCGNGELARRIAPKCTAYTGLDAVEAALTAARKAVPEGRFIRGFLPCDLPDGDHDLIIVSEILYFLDHAGLLSVAQQISARWPHAEILAVNWLGPSGNALQGDEALRLFGQGLAKTATRQSLIQSSKYRIDRFVS
jgi:trans-aconitate methyltransferase